ncbi:unnamed protein product [Brassica rapa]|uniref:Uncharacterized protein n=1 Tax=Brassica campestris TaxID=3711 RepID=A0A8D9GZE4_BRACM|nr:unnamed protein product [Brassica rapa]
MYSSGFPSNNCVGLSALSSVHVINHIGGFYATWQLNHFSFPNFSRTFSSSPRFYERFNCDGLMTLYYLLEEHGSVLCWVGTTAYDLYPLSAKYERLWMPLFPEIDCQEKLWSRVFVIEITGRTTTCTASVRRCCKGYLKIRTCDSQCKPAQSSFVARAGTDRKNSKESNNRQAELSILGKEASKSRTQTKKDRETKEDLRNEIPNREAEKIQESRKQRDRETHNEAEDSCVCSDTISNLELEIGTEHGEARERERKIE